MQVADGKGSRFQSTLIVKNQFFQQGSVSFKDACCYYLETNFGGERSGGRKSSHKITRVVWGPDGVAWLR